MSKSKREMKVNYHGMPVNSEMRLHFYWEQNFSDELPLLGHDLLFGHAVSFVKPLCMRSSPEIYFSSCHVRSWHMLSTMGIFIQQPFEENNKTSPEHAKVVLHTLNC
jgi:hypothetical protein